MPVPSTTPLPDDLIDALSNAAANPAAAELRASRSGVRQSAQQAADAVFTPGDPHGLTQVERLVIAAFASGLAGLPSTAEHYLGWAVRAGADPAVSSTVRELAAQSARSGPYGVHIEPQLAHEGEPGPDLALPDTADTLLGRRLSAALAYTHTVILHPRDGRSGRVQALLDAGFSPLEVSILTQLLCLVSFQLRVVQGLSALAQSPATAEGITA